MEWSWGRGLHPGAGQEGQQDGKRGRDRYSGGDGHMERAAWRGQHETDTQVHPDGWTVRPTEPDNTGLCGHGRNFLGYPTGGGKLLVGLRQAAG